MPEKEKGGAGFDVKTAAVVLAVVGGAYWVQTGLHSSRPGEKETLERTALGDQVVPGRLWQDPFEVVLGYRERHQETIHARGGKKRKTGGEAGAEGTIDPFYTFDEVAKQIWRHWTQATNKQPTASITIL